MFLDSETPRTAPSTEFVDPWVHATGPAIRAREGRKHHSTSYYAKATIATGHKILTAAYHVLSRGVPHNEFGEEFFYRRDTENTERYRRRLINSSNASATKSPSNPSPRAPDRPQ